jgi:ribosomal protein L16 Arg81 hydroxylase
MNAAFMNGNNRSRSIVCGSDPAQKIGASLAAILAPISLEEFIGEYWTKQFLHVAGHQDKFDGLFSWHILNTALEEHRFTADRLKMFKAGYCLDSSRYLLNPNGQINATALMREFRDGASVILDSCEEVHPPLRELCIQLEQVFHVYTQVNLYAGLRTDNAFNVHWDEQDTLILQSAGRKRWKIWQPTRWNPLRQDAVDTGPQTKPTGPPFWDGILEQGDLLSIPRGWWHVAYPVDEPTLHLTVTIRNASGIDLLQWFVEQMKSSETARMSLPITADETERRAWVESLWTELAATWKTDIIDRYLVASDRRATPRPWLPLPHVSVPTISIDRNTPLQLLFPRPLRFETENGTLRAVAGSAVWQITDELSALLDHFNDGLPHTLGELSGNDDAAQLAFMTQLVMQGVLRSVEQRPL